MSQESKRIYLDNAATSWPKPPSVVQAITDYYTSSGNPAGRGNAEDVDRRISQLRLGLAQLIGAKSPNEIVFTFNATDSLNLAIHGLLEPGDHVVTSDLEHNSILRPLSFLNSKGVNTTSVGFDEQGIVNTKEIARAINDSTKLVALSHVSNVTGSVQPVEEVGKVCKGRGVPFLLDAAQSLGHLAIDVESIQCDLLAAPGHKGLYGPLGTGILYVSSRVSERLSPIRQGGTGTQSYKEIHPVEMPQKFEAGNLNVGGLLGLAAGLEFVNNVGLQKIETRDNELRDHLRNGLRDLTKVKLFHGDSIASTSVTSFQLEMDSRQVATILKTSFGIETRAGIHCAPRMHKRIGTLENGGTVRVSPGYFSTIDEINVLLDAISEISNA